MSEHDHIVGYTQSNTLTGTVFLWDYDRKDYQPSEPQSQALINNWLHDTGYIGWFTGSPVGHASKAGVYSSRALKFKDRESKVLFMMAFNVP